VIEEAGEFVSRVLDFPNIRISKKRAHATRNLLGKQYSESHDSTTKPFTQFQFDCRRKVESGIQSCDIWTFDSVYL
jgi:hypothetical protein